MKTNRFAFIRARGTRLLEAPGNRGSILCLILVALVIAACQPPTQKSALPTRAYRGTAIQTTLPVTSITAAAEVSATPAPPTASIPTESMTPPTEPSDFPPPSDMPAPLPLATHRPTQALSPTAVPAQEREQIGEVPADDGQEPVYFPGADDPLQGWEALTGDTALPKMAWKEYTGPLESSLPNTPAAITFRYPAQWTVGSSTSAHRISVLSGETQSEQVKFEILPQASRPNISSEQTGEFQEHAVDIAGDPALLIVYTQDPEKQLLLSVIFQHNQGWYIAVGSIQLSQPDPARVDQLRAILFAMFQSIRVTP